MVTTRSGASSKRKDDAPSLQWGQWGGGTAGESRDDWGLLPGRQTIGPLLLMATTPFLALIIVGVEDAAYQGSLFALFSAIVKDPLAVVTSMYKTPSWEAVRILLIFAASQLALMRLLPGRKYMGPTTAGGNVPVYTDNGLLSFFVSTIAFVLLSNKGYFKLYEIGICYIYYREMISAMCIFAFFFCAFLTFKGYAFPSSSDSGSSGSLIMDYYWGMELYPRVLGFDVKQFTNCRFGMMSWAILPISFLGYNYDHVAPQGQLSYGLCANVAVQLIYVGKFFLWETGYFSSIDIMYDRAGYYICWGCLVWVPSVYVSSSYFLARHGLDLSMEMAAAIFVLGTLAVYINYDADRQRVLARTTNGNCIIWGSKPKTIMAKYRTEKDEEKTSLLLVSGWWGVARHFHYLPEITAAFLWSSPAGFTHFMPYFYVVFLTFLLLDRSFRDDKRCEKKYGKYWAEYKAQVPYKIVPGVI